jgi:hypothetical protein
MTSSLTARQVGRTRSREIPRGHSAPFARAPSRGARKLDSYKPSYCCRGISTSKPGARKRLSNHPARAQP